MKFIVFGLGNYGSSLATKLVALGHEVIGVDSKMEAVERLKDSLTYAVALDASNKEMIETLPLKEADAVIVSIGETPGTAIMTTALLKQMGVKRLICRVITPLQKTVLESMNIHEFIYPEADAAERMAYHLDLKGVIDSHRVSDTHHIIEVSVPERYIGVALNSIPFQDKYNIQLVSLKWEVKEKNLLGTKRSSWKVMDDIRPDYVLREKDSLILFGETEKLETFIGH